MGQLQAPKRPDNSQLARIYIQTDRHLANFLFGRDGVCSYLVVLAETSDLCHSIARLRL